MRAARLGDEVKKDKNMGILSLMAQPSRAFAKRVVTTIVDQAFFLRGSRRLLESITMNAGPPTSRFPAGDFSPSSMYT
jgi:hypothetical protein